jgi:hypothetical protein
MTASVEAAMVAALGGVDRTAVLLDYRLAFVIISDTPVGEAVVLLMGNEGDYSLCEQHLVTRLIAWSLGIWNGYRYSILWKLDENQVLPWESTDIYAN